VDSDDAPFGSGPWFVQVPMSLLRIPERALNSSAKLLYGRLALFARKSGRCNPSHKTLGRETGVSPRHVRNLLAELQRCGLVTWKRTGGSALYAVGPADMFHARKRNSSAARERNSNSAQSGTPVPITRGLSVEVDRKEETTDSDYLPTNRKKHDSPADVRSVPDGWKDLSDLIGGLLGRTPSLSRFGRIVSATPGKADAEAVEGIEDAVRRGYGANSKHRPHTISWFVSVVQNYWADRERRALPPAAPDTGVDSAEFRQMTEAFDSVGDAP
jgi:hypothetical protein